MNPGTSITHPHLGPATVRGNLGTMIRLKLANGEEMIVYPADLAQWKLVPAKDLSPIKVPHNSDR